MLDPVSPGDGDDSAAAVHFLRLHVPPGVCGSDDGGNTGPPVHVQGEIETKREREKE